MTAGLPTIFIGAALSLLVVLPGVLLHHAWLHRLGLSWRASVGLVLGGLTILLTGVSAVVGYSLVVALIVSLSMVIVSLFYWMRNRPSEELASSRIDWPFALMQMFVAGIFIAPVFVLFLPLDTDAQGFGYLALMIREGGTISTLAPWQPDVAYLYSPGMFVWWAFFSDLFQMPLHLVILGFSHLTAALCALLMIDLAETVTPKSIVMRWLMPLTYTAGLGYFLALMDSHYTAVFALLFVVLFLALIFRAQQKLVYALLAALPLACVALTHPDTIIILLLGYIPFYATYWLTKRSEQSIEVWVRTFIIAPVLGVALCAPWAIRVLPLFLEDTIVSPFGVDPGHWVQLVLFQSAIIPLLGFPGIYLALRQRTAFDILMVTWLVFILDFSLYGYFAQIVSVTGIDLMRYAYPVSIAWHAPPIPYAYFASLTLAWLIERIGWKLPHPVQFGLPASGLVTMVLAVIFAHPILSLSQGRINFFGTFSSRSDLEAMHYLRENAAADAIVLNYPLGFEAHWVPVIAEKESITFREQPFFDLDAETYYQRRDDLTDIYFDLQQPDAYEQIMAHGVDYIIVPQIISEPEQFGDMQEMIRWRWPEQYYQEMQSNPTDIDWLEMVFEQDGAAVYQVLPDNSQ